MAKDNFNSTLERFNKLAQQAIQTPDPKSEVLKEAEVLLSICNSLVSDLRNDNPAAALSMFNSLQAMVIGNRGRSLLAKLKQMGWKNT